MFLLAKINKTDIIFLQETYRISELLKHIGKEWDGRIFLKPGTNYSKGTAVFKTCLNFNITNMNKSEDRRIILLNGKVNEQEVTHVNIYAQNNPKDRTLFFQKIQKWISNVAANKEEIIICGDFNFTENKFMLICI